MSNEGIKGKVVIITGASSGLGEAAARHLAREGARLVLAARRTDRLEKIVSELKANGAEAIAVATDVARRADVEALVAAALKAYGHVDVLINNAGVMPLSPIAKLQVDEWDRTIDVNLKGMLYGVAAVLPHMTERKSGQIINIASVAGLKVFSPLGAVYSATKFAVRAFSEGLRFEVGPNIRTTIISPGAIDSELQTHSTDPETDKAVREFYDNYQISADSVARAIGYAISQPADVDINEIVLRPTAQEF